MIEQNVIAFAEKALAKDAKAYIESTTEGEYAATITNGEYLMTIRKSQAPSLAAALCRGVESVSARIIHTKTKTTLEYHSNIDVNTRIKLGSIIRRGQEEMDKVETGKQYKAFEKFMEA
jgi:hypothetical protein